jgi:ligand-binding SRPBCC domain-containing protein
MKLYTLEDRCILNTNLQSAWEFFQNPHNLKLITPPELNLVVTSQTPDRVYAGTVITYTVKPFPLVSFTWVTEITHLQSPNMFVDEQRFGPYKFWHHQHHLKEIDGKVENHDIVSYGITSLPGSDLINAVLVRPKLDSIFQYRQQKLAEIFR